MSIQHHCALVKSLFYIVSNGYLGGSNSVTKNVALHATPSKLTISNTDSD